MKILKFTGFNGRQWLTLIAAAALIFPAVGAWRARRANGAITGPPAGPR